MPCDAPPSSLISFISGACAGLIGALFAHLFSIRRESQNRIHVETTAKAARKRDFLSFMDIWRSRIESANPRNLGEGFRESVAMFRGEQAKIRDDFTGTETQERFGELVNDLARMGKSEIEAASQDGKRDVGKDTLLLRLDEVVKFARAN